MATNIKERIRKIAESKAGSISAFLVEVGFSQGWYNNSELKKLSRNAADRIIAKYPDVNINWVINGTGEMLLDNPVQNKNNSIEIGNVGSGNTINNNSHNAQNSLETVSFYKKALEEKAQECKALKEENKMLLDRIMLLTDKIIGQ